jgi:hypothetical protein
MNVFLIETPHQLINAIEAKCFFNLKNNYLFILLHSDYPMSAYRRLVSDGDWDKIIYENLNHENKFSSFLKYKIKSERLISYIETLELIALRNRLDKLSKSIGEVENLFLGNYMINYMRHFANKTKYESLYLLDDGTATLLVYNEREKNNDGLTKINLTKLKKVMLKKIVGLNSDHPDNLTYFTTYDLKENNKDRFIKNNYEYMKSRALKTKNDDLVYFLGMTAILEGFSDENYFNYMQKVIKYFSNQNLIYIPHKLEPENRIEALKSFLSLKIQKIDVPIEYYLGIFGNIPKILSSFFSSALENCRVIFGNSLNIKVFYVDPEKFPNKPEFVRSVYQYYESKTNESFEVINLEKDFIVP